MRVASDWNSANIIFKSLQDQLSALQTQDINFHGRRITNAGNAINQQDYVTLAQLASLPVVSPVSPQHFTIVLNTSGSVSTGQTTPPFNIGTGRSGQPTEVWVSATNPFTTAATFQIIQTNVANPNGLQILKVPIQLPATQIGPIVVSNFIDPLPFFGIGDLITGLVVSADGTGSQVSIGVVILVNNNISGINNAGGM